MRASLPLLLGAGAVLIGFPAVGTVIDPSLAETQLLTSITGQATGMAWAGDGSNRLFVLDKLGDVWVVQLGVDAGGGLTAMRLPTPFTTVKRADGGPLFTNSECGLIGLAFDPSFATNHFVYFFATVSSTEQQILRFRDAGGAGVDRTVILPGLPTHGVNHDGGGMAFDHEGKLHFAIGDQGDGTGVFRTGGDVQTELSTLAAKSSRINRDGSIPSDNPFFDGAGGNADAIFARGLRDPFRMAIQPSTGLVSAARERRASRSGSSWRSTSADAGFPPRSADARRPDRRAAFPARGAARAAGRPGPRAERWASRSRQRRTR